MIIAGLYSFKGGREIIEGQYGDELQDVREIIAAVDAASHQTKISAEKTMPGRKLFNPRSLNKAYRELFRRRGWANQRVACEYSPDDYVQGFDSPLPVRGAFREMDFVKNRVGVEVQFGKYAFMVYNVCAKMTIFNRLDYIDVGLEIVPVKAFADVMSTGVSYFE